MLQLKLLRKHWGKSSSNRRTILFHICGESSTPSTPLGRWALRKPVPFRGASAGICSMAGLGNWN